MAVVPLPNQYKCISRVLSLTYTLSKSLKMPLPTPPASSIILKSFNTAFPCFSVEQHL
uniref:Kinase n=1 Tax=Rhizophora mucronata TaxID=61149 RepID=A0A2P2MVK0_RHIMU